MKGLRDTIQSGSRKDADVAIEIQEKMASHKKEEKKLEQQEEEQEIEAYLQLVKECGAAEDSEEYYVATMLFGKIYNQTVFCKFTTNEGRKAWLQRCYRDWSA
jgi:hypothetical protein